MRESGNSLLEREVRWGLLSAGGLGVGLAVSLGLAGPIQALVGMMLVTPIVLAIAGSVLGASQSLAMRRFDRTALVWIAWTALGIAFGMTAGTVAVETVARAITGAPMRLVTLDPLGRLVSLLIVGLATGAGVGLAQRFGLRRYAALGTRWILLSALGFGLGLPAGGLAAGLLAGGLRGAVGLTTFVTVAGLVMGALTSRGAAAIAAALDARVQAV